MHEIMLIEKQRRERGTAREGDRVTVSRQAACLSADATGKKKREKEQKLWSKIYKMKGGDIKKKKCCLPLSGIRGDKMKSKHELFA